MAFSPVDAEEDHMSLSKGALLSAAMTLAGAAQGATFVYVSNA
jgi:hypothetical protein